MEVLNLSMTGILFLLVMNLLFLFLLATRIYNVKKKIYSVDEAITSQIQHLKERIELLEKNLKIE